MKRLNRRRPALLVTGAALVAGLCVIGPVAGCTTTQALPAADAPPVAVEPAKLAPGDLIEFKFPYASELNDTQLVRADGRITLQLVGEVQAAGREPRQLQAELEERFAAHLKQPNVSVILRTDVDGRVFVGGSVLQPGVVAMHGPLDAFDALIMAGGLDYDTAAVGHVIVMRRQGDQRVGYRVDLRPALRGEAFTPFALMPGDHVYVPRTAIVNVNQFMRQYVAGLIPRTGVVASKNIGNNTNLGLDTSYSGF